MPTFKLFWSPEGRQIATVEAKTMRAAIRKAPQPFRKFLGEIYAVEEKPEPTLDNWNEQLKNGQKHIQKIEQEARSEGLVNTIHDCWERPEPDFYVENHGSLFLLRPISPAANTWVDEHIPADANYFGGAVVVEHRYIQDIVQGIKDDGLEVL